LDNRSNEDSISLNKYIANTGVCSRREADTLIKEGRVTLNGQPTKPGNRVFAGDVVLVDDKPLLDEPDASYIILNKPPGIVSTTDLNEPRNIISFINHDKRLFTVGRLDMASQGLIILTNDGDIVNKILRAGNAHEKEYIVKVKSPISEEFVHKMSTGVPILGTVTKPCLVTQIDDYHFRITLIQGLNRQIRRMCEFLDYEISMIKRTRIMHLTLSGLRIGEWRELSEGEVSVLLEKTAHSSKTN